MRHENFIRTQNGNIINICSRKIDENGYHIFNKFAQIQSQKFAMATSFLKLKPSLLNPLSTPHAPPLT